MDCRRKLAIDIKPSDSSERKRFLKVVALILKIRGFRQDSIVFNAFGIQMIENGYGLDF